MVDLTNVQYVEGEFTVKDGFNKNVVVDGTPVAASSDETVATVTIEAAADNAWKVRVDAGLEGTARVTVSADADLGQGVAEYTAFGDVTVTLDPRSGARVAELVFGTPADK